jgi:hypothetical protein
MLRSVLLACCASCSFFLVNGPDPSAATKDVSCTDSDTIPAIDAIVGTIGIAGAIGGEIANQVSSHPIHHYELFIGLPALVAGIAFLASTSNGTGKVEACKAAKVGQVRGCDGCPDDIP